jgi:hypothetical protein
MARRGTAGAFSGTLWLVRDLGGGTTRLKNMGDDDGPRFLDAPSQGDEPSLSPEELTLTGARWVATDAGQGATSLQILGGSRPFLDGNTVTGHVGLAQSNLPPFTGTRWRKTSKRPLLFGLDQFKVENCRSKGDHNDSDWLTVTVTSGQKVYPSQTLLLGDNLHAGDQVNGIYAGPFWVGDDDLVTVTFYVINLSHSAADDQRRQAEQIALGVGSAVFAVISVAFADAAFFAKGAKAAADSLLSGIFGAASGVLGGLAGLLGFTPSDPFCNGDVVPPRTLTFLPDAFENRFPSSSSPTSETARSPSECGNDPHSTVIYGVRI